MLVEIADILKKHTREIDSAGRWGGEEFIIICPKTNEKEASKVAQKLRNKIEKNQFYIVKNATASFGVSCYKENDSIDKLLKRVDQAMYLSKEKGKNKVTIK